MVFYFRVSVLATFRRNNICQCIHVGISEGVYSGVPSKPLIAITTFETSEAVLEPRNRELFCVTMSDLAHNALSIVIHEHAGYLQSYAADQSYVADQSRARIRCCNAIMTDCNNDEQLIVESINYNPTAGALARGKRRLAKLRKAALAGIRGLIYLPHDNWDDLSLQLRLTARLPGHLIAAALAPEDWSQLAGIL